MKKIKSLFLLIPDSYFIQLILLGIFVMIIYSHTLNVPFYLDDYPSIVENIIIQNPDFISIWKYSTFRTITYLTFALNYLFHQHEVTGYHVLNILIHFLAGSAVLFFIKSIISIPTINKQTLLKINIWLPFITALIFVLHPLQTQAVTYIVQRLASFAAFFYVSCIASYIKARLNKQNTKIRCLYFIFFIIFGTLALFTKENTFTLFIMIPMVEIIFFQKKNNQSRWIIIGTLLFTSILLFGILAFIKGFNIFSLKNIDSFTRMGTDMSRKTYLYYQFYIIWIYIKLFFIPKGFHLDYEISSAILDRTVFWALSGHLFVIIIAFMLKNRNQLISFFILFYYVTHLIESSILPIKDLCFEHRTYLPNIGLSFLTAYFFLFIIANIHKPVMKHFSIVLLVLYFILLGSITWQRNQMWNDPINFWQDCSIFSPHKSRVWAEFGKHLMLAKRNKEAINAFSNAIKFSEDQSGHKKLDIQIVCNLIVLFHKTGQTDRALKLTDRALKQPMNALYMFYMLNNKGNIYLEKKEFSKAERCYHQAIKTYPNNKMAVKGLYNALMLQGRIDEAKKIILKLKQSNDQ